MKNKIINTIELKNIRKKYSNKKIVHCHGVYDMLHHGHFLHLHKAKELGDITVVTVTSDQFVNKGPKRPYFSQEQRAFMLSSLELVDYVAINDNALAINIIKSLKPDIYLKGNDYKNIDKDRTGGIAKEKEAVESVGGKLIFTDEPTNSSTELLNEYFLEWDEEQRKTLEDIKESQSVDSIISLIDSFIDKKILVVGEPIIDSYVYSNAQNMASKSPIISSDYKYREDCAGGSLAIANHLSELGCQVTLLLTHGNDDKSLNFIKGNLLPNVKLISHALEGQATPQKTRYLNIGHNEKLFEITNLPTNQWKDSDPKNFINDLLHYEKESDLVIISDFGHGLFQDQVLKSLKKIKSFTALNVQTNSGNLGFNYFIKHNRYDYLCLDKREFRLALHDRISSVDELININAGNKFNLPASMTLGPEGSMYIDKNGLHYKSPIFFKDVIDTTGAGDAYFAITSLLVSMDVESKLIPFIGNCHAGLKTRIIGNKKVVSKLDLLRTIKSILT